MDSLQPFGSEDHGPADSGDEAIIEAPPAIGTDERRMHVRAYNYWASLLRDRAYPSIEDLDPANIEDFGPNSVLLDFTAGVNNPTIAWLGGALREECDISDDIKKVSEVPNRSLLSRLTDHYMQIIANQAPVGFEAEFVNHRNLNTMYRGILMPFSSDDDTIDFIYGIINWKEVVDAATEHQLQDAVDEALSAPVTLQHEPSDVWADGPSADREMDQEDIVATIEDALASPETLVDHLVVARESAEQAKSADKRSRSALYDALGQAFDFACFAEADAEGYQAILEDAGITQQERAPMTPIVKLIFGIDYDKTRLTEFATALAYAKREAIAAGTFAEELKRHKGGLKAIVAAERAARRPAAKPDLMEAACEDLRHTNAQAFVTIDGEGVEGEEFVLLMARRMADGRLAVLGPVPPDKSLTERAIRKITR
jgi:hypothetical protein